jgi:hypothetical protein
MWFVMLFLGLAVFAALASLVVACERLGGIPP